MAELLLLALILIGFAAIIIRTVSSNFGVPKAVEGVLDLSDWHFDKSGTVMLGGKWAFYWDRLGAPEPGVSPDLYAKVPAVWNSYTLNGEKLPGFGCATYSLRVEVAGEEPLAIRMPPCSTAYALYVDGTLLAKNGTVSRTAEGFNPAYEPESVTFTPKSDSFTLTLLVSNFVYARGGVWYPPVLGTPEQIASIDRYIEWQSWFLIGSFNAIALFCFCFCVFARAKRPLLLFAFLALDVALRTSIYGSYALSTVLPFRLVVIADYLTLIWILSLIALFLLNLADFHHYRKIRPVILTIATLLSIFIAATPIHVFTQTTLYLELYMVALSIYVFCRLLTSRVRSKTAIALGAAAFILCGIYDVLYQGCYVMGVSELSSVGFFIMLCTWGIVLAQAYAELSTYASVSAEKAHAAEIAFLQAQIKPHFLYNTLNVIATLCRLDGAYAEKLTLDLAKYLRYSFEFNNFSKFISFSAELEFVETYVKIEQARFVDAFDFVLDLCDTTGLVVPPLSIQPLVENAIRHGIRQKEAFGTVVLSVKEEKDGYSITVSDDGVGIPPEKLSALRQGVRGENAGVGLLNVKQRIENLRGARFAIDSSPGQGTSITITIPKNIQELNAQGPKAPEQLLFFDEKEGRK